MKNQAICTMVFTVRLLPFPDYTPFYQLYIFLAFQEKDQKGNRNSGNSLYKTCISVLKISLILAHIFM